MDLILSSVPSGSSPIRFFLIHFLKLSPANWTIVINIEPFFNAIRMEMMPNRVA